MYILESSARVARAISRAHFRAHHLCARNFVLRGIFRLRNFCTHANFAAHTFSTYTFSARVNVPCAQFPCTQLFHARDFVLRGTFPCARRRLRAQHFCVREFVRRVQHFRARESTACNLFRALNSLLRAIFPCARTFSRAQHFLREQFCSPCATFPARAYFPTNIFFN